MIGLILEAGLIPDGTEVSKVTGEKKYILRRQLKIYSQSVNGPKVEIRIDDNYKPVFLVDGDTGSINVVSPTSKLRVDRELEEVREFIEEILLEGK